MATPGCRTDNGSLKSEQSAEDVYILPNPLTNTLVVAKIVLFMNIPNLKKCRLVCKIWNRFAMSVLCLRTHIDLRRLTPKQIDECVVSIHRGLTLPPVNVIYSFGSHRRMCEKLLNFYGSRTKSLHLSGWEDDICGRNVISIDRYYLSTVLLTPLYLRSLSLDILPHSLVSATSLFPRPLPRHPPLLYVQKLSLRGCTNFSFGFLLDLLFAMPNLGELCIRRPSEVFLTTLMKVLNTHHFRHLVSLEINPTTHLTSCHLWNLNNASLRLKTLRLKDYYCKTDERSLQNLMQGYRSTLEELHLPPCLGAREKRDFKKFMLFPHMEVLRKLTVDDWAIVGSLSFVEKMPRLETLTLEAPENFSHDRLHANGKENSIIVTPIGMEHHTRLRELILPVEGLFMPDEIKGILLAFPKLEKLSLHVLEEATPELWKYGTNLKYLHLYIHSYLSDYCVAGLQIERDSFIPIHNAMISDDINGVGHLRKRNFIGNLQNLEVLKIDHHSGQISDIAVIFGIATLPKLKHLSLHSAQITDLSLKALEKLPLLKLELLWKTGEPIFISLESLKVLQSNCPCLEVHYQPIETWNFISLEVGEKLFSNPWFYAPDPDED